MARMTSPRLPPKLEALMWEGKGNLCSSPAKVELRKCNASQGNLEAGERCGGLAQQLHCICRDANGTVEELVLL